MACPVFIYYCLSYWPTLCLFIIVCHTALPCVYLLLFVILGGVTKKDFLVKKHYQVVLRLLEMTGCYYIGSHNNDSIKEYVGRSSCLNAECASTVR